MCEESFAEFWNQAKNLIREEYKNQNKEDFFSLWSKIEYAGQNKNQNTILATVENQFMKAQVISRGIVQEFEKKLSELSGKPIKIQIEIQKNNFPKNFSDATNAKNSQIQNFSESKNSEFQNLKNQTENFTEKKSTQQNQQSQQNLKNFQNQNSQIQILNNEKFVPKHPQLQEIFSFENFVPAENNLYAYNACVAVAKNPGITYNPLLLFGASGLGKTHLMQAVGNFIFRECGEKTKLAYAPTESFMNEFIYSIQSQTTEKFKRKYRTLDVLLLDDIQFLEGAESTQDELFHTFNAIKDKRGQMIFTCDRPLSQIKGITDRLTTRFKSGITIDLKPPKYEARVAIIQKKLQIKKCVLEQDVIEYIAKSIQTNVSDLSSCLDNVIAYSDLSGKKITLSVAMQRIEEFLENLKLSFNSSKYISTDEIQKIVAKFYNVSVLDLKSKKRDSKYNTPRQIAIYIARKITEATFPELGRDFGGRDHTTMMHAYEKISEAIKVDSSLGQTIQELIDECRATK